MSKRTKVIMIIVVGLIVVASAVYLFVYNSVDGLDTSTHKDSKIVFPVLNDTVYLMASSWGLTGDHIEIVLSHTPIVNRSSNVNPDYFFYDPTIYYKQEYDTLVIYSLTLANVPGNFNTRIKIKQVKLEGREEMKKYEEIHETLGLTKISIYK